MSIETESVISTNPLNPRWLLPSVQAPDTVFSPPVVPYIEGLDLQRQKAPSDKKHTFRASNEIETQIFQAMCEYGMKECLDALSALHSDADNRLHGATDQTRNRVWQCLSTLLDCRKDGNERDYAKAHWDASGVLDQRSEMSQGGPVLDQEWTKQKYGKEIFDGERLRNSFLKSYEADQLGFEGRSPLIDGAVAAILRRLF
uniref:AlNc14C468G11820 protein n=1 Tax=Albugo laibachii Nc14 TaxID=890382 RepID=F0X082_9STRA|nr:AlNc14C468G11820 [Albugo laibachii Nc14]|eukprot:CCA27164.1 AlNc14C468G11820 [Albugo laibachii Nc14]